MLVVVVMEWERKGRSRSFKLMQVTEFACLLVKEMERGRREKAGERKAWWIHGI